MHLALCFFLLLHFNLLSFVGIFACLAQKRDAQTAPTNHLLCNNVLLTLLKVAKNIEKLWLLWVTLETLASINIKKKGQELSYFCYLQCYNKILPCWRLLNSFVLTICFEYYSNIYMHFEGVNLTNGWSCLEVGSETWNLIRTEHI